MNQHIIAAVTEAADRFYSDATKYGLFAEDIDEFVQAEVNQFEMMLRESVTRIVQELVDEQERSCA